MREPVSTRQVATTVRLPPFSALRAEPNARRGFSMVRASMPPLRGVLHAAMVIDDGLISDLDAARIQKVFAPKVQGAMHLDAATRDRPLDFFVVFSSATTVFGNPGQASYVAANRFLEYLVEHRRVKGLPALAVSWGPIDDVGYLARNRGVGEALESRLGGRALSAKEALDTLDRLLAEDRSGIAVLNFDWSHLRRALPAASSARFSRIHPMCGIRKSNSSSKASCWPAGSGPERAPRPDRAPARAARRRPGRPWSGR